MFGFGKKPIAKPIEARPQPSAPPNVSNVKVGAKLGNLTCLGKYFVDFDAVEMINLRPVDNCGAEIQFKSGETMHLSQYGGACLQKYIDQQNAEIAELEKIGAQ